MGSRFPARSLFESDDHFLPTYPLAILPFHVHEVGGVEAAVHALLVSGDAALDSDAAGSWPHHKLLQVGHVHEGAVASRGRSGAHQLLTCHTNILSTFSTACFYFQQEAQLLTGTLFPLAAEAGLVASVFGDNERGPSSASSSFSLASSKFMLPDRPVWAGREQKRRSALCILEVGGFCAEAHLRSLISHGGVMKSPSNARSSES